MITGTTYDQDKARRQAKANEQIALCDIPMKVFVIIRRLRDGRLALFQSVYRTMKLVNKSSLEQYVSYSYPGLSHAFGYRYDTSPCASRDEIK